MPSKDIVNSSQLYIDEKKTVFAFTLLLPSATIVGKPLHDMLSKSNSWYDKQLDPVEYGMGFQRGETNEFVESGANRITCEQVYFVVML